MKRPYSPEEVGILPLSVNLPSYVIKDLKAMEQYTHQSLDTLVLKALQMFIATHSDYLGNAKPTG